MFEREKNYQAINELRKGNEELARDLFRQNAKENPCCTTLNNIGVYYSQYGLLQKNGKVRSAKKIGLYYLLKASTYSCDWRNCVSTATTAWECGDLHLSYKMLLKSNQLCYDNTIYYNIGCCLYWLEDYVNALAIFKSLCTESVINRIISCGGQNPLLVLAYCQLKLHNIKECIESIQEYRSTWAKEDYFDVFCLRYYCGMYSEALSECRELLNEWYPTDFLLAVIADCIYKNSNAEIEVPIPLDKKKKWEYLKVDHVARMKKIKEHSFFPPFICMYHFIGD